MAKTLDDLQNLLSNHGYTCEQKLDVILMTRVRTNTYKDPTGSNTLDILLSFDRPNDCVAVEVLRAFDLRAAEHREATLACLMAASFRTALLRPSLDTTDDEIRLRIDCPCGEEGARDADVLRALALLPSFVEAWYPQVISAMESGEFEPNEVPRLNLSSTLRASPPAGEEEAEAIADASPIGEIARVSSMAQKPGAHPNRLRALFEFHRRRNRHHDRRDDRQGDQPRDQTGDNPADCN